jgi:hypothetical protein
LAGLRGIFLVLSVVNTSSGDRHLRVVTPLRIASDSEAACSDRKSSAPLREIYPERPQVDAASKSPSHVIGASISDQGVPHYSGSFKAKYSNAVAHR